MLSDHRMIRNLDWKLRKSNQCRASRRKSAHCRKFTGLVKSSGFWGHRPRIVVGEPGKAMFKERRQAGKQIPHIPDQRTCQRAAAMRSRHENDSYDATIPPEKENALQLLDCRAVTLKPTRRNPENALPEPILA